MNKELRAEGFVQDIASLSAQIMRDQSGALLPAIDYHRDIILKNCHLVQVRTGQVIKNARMRISQGTITALGDQDLDSSGAQVIDCGGTYAIPGLIDAHCHITSPPVFGLNAPDIPHLLKALPSQFIRCITSGVTTVRDMGAFPGLLHCFIHAIEKGLLMGPRVVYCNSIMNVNGSHPDIKPTDVSIFAGILKLISGLIQYNFKDLRELKKALPKNARGASLVKLTVDNRSVFCRPGEIPVYSDEELREIFRFADHSGLPVACHNHRHWGFTRMLDYPVHSMEHMIGDGFLSDSEIMRLAKNKTAVVPTLTVAQSYLLEEAYDSLPQAYRRDFILEQIQVRRNYLNNEAPQHFDPVLIRKAESDLGYYKTLGWDHLWENKKFLVNPDLYFGVMLHAPENLRKMKEAGILIGCGIDAGMPFNYFGGLYREFDLLSACGFTNAEVLRCATINNAKILCLEDKIGALEAGKCADIVLFEDNPLENLKALRAPSGVIKAGRVQYAAQPLNLV